MIGPELSVSQEPEPFLGLEFSRDDALGVGSGHGQLVVGYESLKGIANNQDHFGALIQF